MLAQRSQGLLRVLMTQHYSTVCATLSPSLFPGHNDATKWLIIVWLHSITLKGSFSYFVDDTGKPEVGSRFLFLGRWSLRDPGVKEERDILSTSSYQIKPSTTRKTMSNIVLRFSRGALDCHVLKHRERERERERETETETETDRDTERETERPRQRDWDRDRKSLPLFINCQRILNPTRNSISKYRRKTLMFSPP